MKTIKRVREYDHIMFEIYLERFWLENFLIRVLTRYRNAGILSGLIKYSSIPLSRHFYRT